MRTSMPRPAARLGAIAATCVALALSVVTTAAAAAEVETTLANKAPPANETAQAKGLRLARQMDQAGEGFKGEASTLQMVLINAHGDKVTRRMRSRIFEKRGGDRSLIVFEWPADVKDTRMLTWTHSKGADDQWLYLPSLKRIKRISSRNKSASFMGSEFAYEDLASQEVEKYTYRFLEDTQLDGRPCHKIERIPVDKGSGYSKQHVWMDVGYDNVTRIEYFDRKGELLKTAEFKGYKQHHNKWWRAGEIHVTNAQTKKESILTWQKHHLLQDFDESDFDRDSLEDA